MGKFNFEQMMSHKTGGGSSFFSLKEGEEAHVRFLYNTLADIEGYWAHEFNQSNASSNATILCAANEEGTNKGDCKWCTSGNNRVERVVLPLYNEDAKEIQYFKRSGQYVKENLVEEFQEVLNQNMPIASQIFRIKRSGSGVKTKYTATRTGGPDGKKKEEFGELKDPISLNIIRPVDTDFDPYAAPVNTQEQTFINNQNQQPQATRRTTDVF